MNAIDGCSASELREECEEALRAVESKGRKEEK